MVKLTEAESKMVVVGGSEEGEENDEFLINGFRGLVMQDE